MWVKATISSGRRAPRARRGSCARTAICLRRRERARWTAPCIRTCGNTSSTAPTTPENWPVRCEVRIHSRAARVKPGEDAVLAAVVVNAKAGHSISFRLRRGTGVWLHVEARDVSGKTYPLRVDAKGFPGEEYTIASSAALAYQDIGEIRGLADFKGLAATATFPTGIASSAFPTWTPRAA